jgi:ABC-type phosphate/phosphonate transport system substrate-binding protein
MRSIKNSVWVFFILLLGGCAAPPISMKIAVNDIYCTDTACECIHDVAARRYTETLEQLKTEYSIDLQFDYFMEPYDLEAAILSGQYDGVLSKPWTALMLQKQAGADFKSIVDLLDPNNNPWLTGILVVRADSPFQTLADLNGKHIYLGQPDAYEKNQAAKRMLETKGIQPARIDTKASCSENIGILLDERADAAVVSDYALSAGCAVDFANPEDFRILAHTERIPLTSLLLDMNKISTADATRLQTALLTLSTPDTLLGNGFVKPAAWNPLELEEQR